MDIYEFAVRSRPDLIIILDVPADVGLARISSPLDRMEAKGETFHRKVRELFLAQAKEASKTTTVLDGTGSVADVQDRLRACVESWRFLD